MSPEADLAAATPAEDSGRRRPLLPRLHLFEIEDQPWFPRFLRDYATDYLCAMQEWLGLSRAIAPQLAQVLRESGERRIVDLCSGGGGPMAALARELHDLGLEVEVVLTDKYPNLRAFERAAEGNSALSYVVESVDAAAVPPELAGLRTLFNGLHHFRPAEAKALLEDAAHSGRPIAVFEVSRRSLGSLLSMLIVPIVVLLVTPFLRPWRWGRLLWTYFPPVVPLVCLWDGLVSQLRAYSPSELLALAPADSPALHFRSGQFRKRGGTLTYLVGVPESQRPTRDSQLDGQVGTT